VSEVASAERVSVAQQHLIDQAQGTFALRCTDSAAHVHTDQQPLWFSIIVLA
jgi:hypothetical protein